mgnify:CR=1 FL=1
MTGGDTGGPDQVRKCEAFKALQFAGDESHTIEQMISQMVATIGENIVLSRIALVEAGQGNTLSSYIHGGGKIGVVVEGAGGATPEALHEVALHVAAAEPRFVNREPGSGTRGAMMRFFKGHNINVKTGMELGSLEGIKQGVQAELGLGVVPRGAIDIELQLGKLVELKVKGLPIWRKWYVVLHKAKRLSVAAEEFRSLLINEAVDLLQD